MTTACSTFPTLLGMAPTPGLLFGLMLAAAIVGGYVARLVHVPRIVGFLLGGVALRMVLSTVFSSLEVEQWSESLEAAAQPLRTVKDLALGLILFTIGGAFEQSKLRAAWRRTLRISLLEVCCTIGLVFLLTGMVLLISRPSPSASQNLVLALLLALAAVETAPAATLFVLQEYDAKGPVTDTMISLTAANNIVCIVAFQVVFLLLGSLGTIETTGSLTGRLPLTLLISTVGSVALGVLAGTTISMIHAKLPLTETLLMFFAIFILLGAGEPWLWQHRGLSYNFLLTALVMGAIFANVAIDAQKLESALHTVGLPIYAGFFVMAGYSLHVADLMSMGWLGGAYVSARLAGKWLGCTLGVRWAREPERADNRLGPAMLCQAAIIIGLASFVERNWDSPLASRFVTVSLGSVVLFELIAPLLVKRCVVQAGEVKAITLLSRQDAATEGISIVRLTLQSLARLTGWRPASETGQADALRVQHIMRTNVQFVRASATFDDVLHHIERSTYSHFPVVHENGDFAGMIHFNDVHDVIYDPALSELVTAVDLADAESTPIPMGMPLRELLDLFTRMNVAALPVTERADSRRVIGLVEQRDLLRALHLSKETV